MDHVKDENHNRRIRSNRETSQTIRKQCKHLPPQKLDRKTRKSHPTRRTITLIDAGQPGQYKTYYF